MSSLPTRPYLEQAATWPSSGRHILAHFDHDSIVVYQAYSPSIARHALEEGVFGGPEFSFSRMSWIKPSFLWMMYRSAWGTAERQESVLAVRIRRAFFERLLALAVPSAFGASRYSDEAAWRRAIEASDVRLQWDPDHDPSGDKLERRAIQLGLRGEVLRQYANTEILSVADMTPFVAEQRVFSRRGAWGQLVTPQESVYTPSDRAARENVGLY